MNDLKALWIFQNGNTCKVEAKQNMIAENINMQKKHQHIKEDVLKTSQECKITTHPRPKGTKV